MKKILAILLVLTLVLASCAPKVAEEKKEDKQTEKKEEKKTEKKEDKKEETTKKEEEKKDEVVEISFWNFPSYAVVDDTPGKYEEMAAEAFMAKNPNIKVKVEMLDFKAGPEKLNTAIAAGTGPDVVGDAPGRIISWGNDGVLVPLNDMFNDDFKANVGEAIRNTCKSGDKVWMYPANHVPFMMAFNKTMLEKHDLMGMLNLEGDRSWTVEQYEALLKALKEKGERGPIIFGASQGGDQGTRAFLANLYNSPVTNEDLTAYTMNTDKGVKSLEWLKKAVDEGLLENGSALDAGAAIDAFVQEQVSGTILWSPVLEKIKAPTFETVYVPFPNDESPKLEFYVGGFCVFDKQDEKRAEAAKKFVDFMTNDPEWAPKNIKATGGFPADARIKVEYGNPMMDYNASMVPAYTTYYNIIPGFAEMRTFWFPTVQAVMNGEKDAKTALDEFVEKSNATIK